MPKIATSSFVSGPDDKLAAVDVYRSNTAVIANGIVGTANSAVTDARAAVQNVIKDEVNAAKSAIAETLSVKNLTQTAVNAMLNGGFNKDDLLNNFSSLALDKKSALGKLRDAVGGPLNSITNLENLKTNLVTNMLGSIGFTENPEALAKGLLGLPGSTDPINVLLNDNPKLKVVYNGVSLIRDSKDTDSAKGLVSLANSIAGNSELAKVLDMETQFAVMGNLLATASIFGVPQVIDTVLDKLDNDEEKAALLLDNTNSALSSGDVVLLSKILDFNSSDLVQTKSGGSVKSLLSNYRYPVGFDKTNITSYTNALTELVTLLNRLDVHWDGYSRNGVYVSNIEAFSVCSEDAYNLFIRDPIYKDRALISKTYTEESLIDLGIKKFPWVGNIIRNKAYVVK